MKECPAYRLSLVKPDPDMVVMDIGSYTDEPKHQPLTDATNNIDYLITRAHAKVWDILDGR